MKYVLLQIDSGESLHLDKDYWLKIIKTAEQEGWEPEGTRFDLMFELDDAFSDSDDEMYKLFQYITKNNDYIEWNGNYTDKANQVISEPDAYYLYQAIEGVIDDPPLHDILMKGNLRICK